MFRNHLCSLLKHKLLGLVHTIFTLVDLAEAWKFTFSVPDDTADPLTTFRKPLINTIYFELTLSIFILNMLSLYKYTVSFKCYTSFFWWILQSFPILWFICHNNKGIILTSYISQITCKFDSKKSKLRLIFYMCFIKYCLDIDSFQIKYFYNISFYS